jgi:hypothetical protein
MLGEARFRRRAQSVAQRLQHEDGVRTACDALEELYQRTVKPNAEG